MKTLQILFAAAFAMSTASAIERPVPPSVLVESVQFRQRYPWNGLVDIDAKITCSDPATNLATKEPVTTKPTEKPAEKPVAKPDVAAKPAAKTSDRPVFKVQVLASSNRLKVSDAQLKGQKDVDCYMDGGMYKYTVGASEDYNAIYQLRKTLLSRFPQAFIIAFKDGKRMDVQEAIQEFKKGKKVK